MALNYFHHKRNHAVLESKILIVLVRRRLKKVLERFNYSKREARADRFS